MKNNLFLALAFMTILIMGANAQERAAGGSADLQMTWSALTTQVNGAVVKIDAVNTRVDQAVTCGRKGMVYAPGANGADTSGCVSAQYVNSIVTCGNQGKIYNASTNACVIPGELSNLLNCGSQNKIYSAATNSCVDGANDSRWYNAGDANDGRWLDGRLPHCGSDVSPARRCTKGSPRCAAVTSSQERSCGSHQDSTCTTDYYSIFVCD